MAEINLVKDADFLIKLDQDNNKKYFVKILVLDRNEVPIRAIEGRTQVSGTININGDSAIRRTANITFLAKETENDLTDVDNLLAINKKIRLLIGLENHVDKNHDDVIWFKQGVFVINSPSLQHNNNGVLIQLSLKDKMCLLNGECGGNLPTSVTFDHYDQIVGYQERDSFPQDPNDYTIYRIGANYWQWNPTKSWTKVKDNSDVGSRVSVSQCLFDIIQTCVCNFGGEDIGRIIINDVPLEIRNTVRWGGNNDLYFNPTTSQYTLNENVVADRPGEWTRVFGHNEDCGYIYTALTYPESSSSGLISGIGDNVASILDKVKNVLGNYEYFYDIDGNFVFQEKKNYMNTSFEPAMLKTNYENMENAGAPWQDTDFYILNKENYFVDFSHHTRSAYTFDEGSILITSYSNNPNYGNIKNDFHIWGKNQEGSPIHYHLAVKSKPEKPYPTYQIIKEKDKEGKLTGRVRIPTVNDSKADIINYTPTDWRAAIYMSGLDKKSRQMRPDIYEQELLDLFDDIYDMANQQFKIDIVFRPNDLKYWFDYINPAELHDISVDVIGSKIYSYQQDNIKRLYTTDVPCVVMIGEDNSVEFKERIRKKCFDEGQPYANVSQNIYDNVRLGSIGYAAQEIARDLLYQYTTNNSTVSISSIPIYYLEPNTRITIRDRASEICGEYVIKSISLPLDGKATMTISATEALQREG